MAINREAVVAAAEKLVARGKIEGAIKEYRKLVADNPADSMTLNRLGDLYVRLSKNDEAVRLFTQIAERYTEDGFFVKAIAIFKKIIKLDPTRLPVYERLAELYHKQGLVSEARTQYQVLVDYYLKHGKGESAESVLNKMTALDSGDPTPHVKLAEIYRERGEHDKELAEYRALAEMMIRHKRVDEAMQVYSRAINSSPADLGFVTDAVLGLKDAGHTAAAAKLLALAIEKNPQAEKIARIAGLSRDRRADSGGARRPGQPGDEPRVFKVSDVASAPPELRMTSPQASSAPAAARPELHPDDLRSAQRTAEELDQTLSERRPEALRRAAAAPPPAADAEIDLDFDLELEIEGVDEETPPAAAELDSGAPIEADIDWTFEPGPELEIDLEMPPAAAPPAEATPTAAPAGSEPEARAEPAPVVEPAPLADSEEVAQPAAVAPVRTAAQRLADLVAEAEVFRKYGLAEKSQDRVREVLREEPRHPAALALAVHLSLDAGRPDRALARAQELAAIAAGNASVATIWSPVRGRLERGGFEFSRGRPSAAPEPEKPRKDSVTALLEELAGLSRAPAARRPDSSNAKLSALVDGLRPKATPKSAPPPAAAPQVDRDDTGEEAIDDRLAWLDEAAARATQPKAAGPTGADDGLFEEEEGFFDLAAELEEELTQEEIVTGQELLPREEPSLEEIVEGFKKGVAESLSPEDYDTHFNLGIAYREMGLLDEAIGEFQLAAKHADYLLDCCSLLGGCFLEKGLPELAVKWYQRGLASPNLSEDANLGLLYDLGTLYTTIGDEESARRTLVELYGINSNYRDVGLLLEQLGSR